MKRSNIKKYLYLLGIGIFLFFIGLYVIDYLGMNWYIEWAFSFINNLFIDGSKDSSVNELVQNHYFLPNSIVDLLIGISDFHSTEKSTYHSDVGYVIYIYGTGLIGVFAFLFILFRILFETFRYFENDKAIGFLIIFIILSLLIINFKDFYIFYPYSHYILLFLLLMKFNSNKRINREK